MVVKFLYSVREFDPTLIVALESITAEQSKVTTQTKASVPHILDAQQNKIKYYAITPET